MISRPLCDCGVIVDWGTGGEVVMYERARTKSARAFARFERIAWERAIVEHLRAEK